MQTRRETAWKKSRKFGDVKGGRKWPKIADKIFSRAHSLERPDPQAQLPIFISDNPSRDYFFPINETDIRRELAHLPKDDWKAITHIWFRKFRKSDYEAHEIPLAQFTCGSGVRLITLYPWPRSQIWNHGSKKPTAALQKVIANYEASLVLQQGTWISDWTGAALKDFYVEYLLFHEIGHHVDWYHRHWSKANHLATETAANEYAFVRTFKRCLTYRQEPSPT